jgi:hypothetical protein
MLGVMTLRALLMSVVATLAATAAIAGPLGHYVNARFHYSVDYPSDLMRPLPESENGDGRAFAVLLPTRADVRVYGGFNAMNRSAEQIVRDFEEECHGRASYRVTRPDLAAASCAYGGEIFYQKTLIRGDRLVSLHAQYLVSARRQLDPAIARMASSLRIR